jgi:HemY protein
MKKWLLILGLGLIGAVVIYHTLGAESYVLVKVGETSIQTGLWVVLLGLMLLYIVWHWLAWFVAGLFGGGWMRQMRERQMAENRREGLKAMVEGNWSMAKAEFQQLAKRGENSKYNYLLAARASEKMGSSGDADRLLSVARSLGEGSDLGVDLEQIRLHLQRLEVAEALRELEALAKKHPNNSEILSLTMRGLVIAQQWAKLRQVVIQARKAKLLKLPHFKYEKQLYIHLVGQRIVGNEAKVDHLREIHSEIPSGLLEDPDVIYALVDEYRRAGEHDRAETILRQTINSNWNGQLVRLYGEIYSSKLQKQLGVAERWLRKHPGDVDLLLTLEELSRQADDWEKSRHYGMLARTESGEESASLDNAKPLSVLAPETDSDEDIPPDSDRGLTEAKSSVDANESEKGVDKPLKPGRG